MKHAGSLIVPTIAVSLAIACGDGDGGTPTVESICQRGCAIVASLNCPNEPEDCQADCVDNANTNGTICRSEFLAYGDCLADEPASSFECNSAGNAEQIGRLCTEQNIVLEVCYEGTAGSGG